MRRSFDIAVVGELNPDLILSGDVHPEFGQTEKLVDSAALTIGSSSAIFACGAARLGLKTAFLGKVGDDLLGSFMIQSLEKYHIDTRGIVIDKEIPTGISVILSTGVDRAILTYPGTIPRMKYSELNLDIIRQARHLHVGSFFIQEALHPDLGNLFGAAKKHGLSISMDTNFDPDEEWDGRLRELIPMLNVFLPNEIECRRISRKSSLDDAIDDLGQIVEYLGVKCGSDGAFLTYQSTQFRADALPVKVVDTVGAGDSFDAGFVYGYLAGWQPERIIKFACICGSLSTRRSGGTSAQPTLDEAMSYL
jgi:sugar/nucleoside kinase (ribokinase family)